VSPSHDGDGASPLPRSRYVTGPIAYLDSSEIIPGRLGQCFREGAAAVIIAGDPAVAELWQLLMAEPSTMPWMASLYQLAANLLPHDDLTEALGDVYYFKPGRHSYIGRKIEIVADGETLVARPDRFDQPGGDQQMAVDLIEKCWRFCSIIMQSLGPVAGGIAGSETPFRAVVQRLKYGKSQASHEALFRMVRNSLGPWGRIGSAWRSRTSKTTSAVACKATSNPSDATT